MKTKLSLTNISRGLAPSLVLATLIAFCPLRLRADTVALSFTGGFQHTFASDLTLGWTFNLSDSVLLTQLGLYDATGGGLAQSHTVTIWNSTGTLVPGAQATVPSGTGPETNNFRYVTLATPVLLAPGTYTIGGYFNSGSDPVGIFATTITTASGVTYNGSRSVFGNAFPPDDSTEQANNSYFGPNFQFEGVGVPEPGTWAAAALLALGLFSHFVRRRRVV